MGGINSEVGLNNTFLNKVVAERRALAVVNKKFTGNRQLSGLSEAAIMQWQSKVSIQNTKDVLPSLLELGELCQSLSNRSNESFQSLPSEVECRIEESMVRLQTVVAAA